MRDTDRTHAVGLGVGVSCWCGALMTVLLVLYVDAVVLFACLTVCVIVLFVVCLLVCVFV